MRCKLLASLLCFALLAGCGAVESVPIEPLPAGQGRPDLGLGPGVRALSSGPGEKSAPSWGPGDERIAFIVDGYVVDKPLYAQDLRRRTTKDFEASKVQWGEGDEMVILGADALSGEDSSPGEADLAVYRTLPGEGSLGVERITTGALAMIPGSEGRGLIVAIQTSTYQSGLALVGEDGSVDQVYTNLYGGRVTGLSLSPDGGRLLLAVRGAATYSLHVLDLADGSSRTVARLEPGLDIFGAAQWTRHGIYYVAGDEEATGEQSAALYNLYRIGSRSDAPEPAPGVGEDFVASSLRASPDGERLAIVGRRNPTSSSNLYVLDLNAGELEAATANEDMEIKTGPEDLAWSSSGESVAVVARGPVSGHEVHAAPADTLLTDFYNLYEVPVEAPKAADG